MIPLRDNNPSGTFPIVTVSIIAANIILFVFTYAISHRPASIIETFGMIPRNYTDLSAAREMGIIRLFLSFYGSMFMHDGWLHIISNMWFLWIFGDNIEDRIGHVKYLIFYLLCGTAGGILFIAMNHDSVIPCIGASGAVSGILGAYMLAFPRARILTLVPVFIIIFFTTLPALFVLLAWFVLQILYAYAEDGTAAGIAWWAHIGGFLCGIVLIAILKKRKYFRDRS